MENLLQSFTKQGFQIKVHEVFDESPDTSYLGEYTDSLETGVIVRHFDKYFEDLTEEEQEELYPRGREFRGFKPYAAGEKVGSEDYKKYGLKDYKRMEGLDRGDWNFIGITVAVFKKDIELGNSSLWGIESDSEKEFIEDTIKNLTSDAIAEAKKNLKELCSVKGE